jgi:hypothetical protein
MQLCKSLVSCCGLLQQVFGSAYLWTDPQSKGDRLLLEVFKEAIVAKLDGQGLFKGKTVESLTLLSAVGKCTKEAIEATLSKGIPEGETVTPPFHFQFATNATVAVDKALLFTLTEVRNWRKPKNISEAFLSKTGLKKVVKPILSSRGCLQLSLTCAALIDQSLGILAEHTQRYVEVNHGGVQSSGTINITPQTVNDAYQCVARSRHVPDILT